MPGSLEIIPLRGLPLIQPGDKLPRLLVRSAERLKIGVKNQDIFVIGQKVVSKSEGQLVDVDRVRLVALP